MNKNPEKYQCSYQHEGQIYAEGSASEARHRLGMTEACLVPEVSKGNLGMGFTVSRSVEHMGYKLSDANECEVLNHL